MSEYNYVKPTDYELDLPISSEEISSELHKKTKKGWVTANLSPQSAWVKEITKIWFKSRFIYLIPLEDDKPAYATTLIMDGEAYKDTQKVLSSFFSSLSWVKTIPLSVEHWSGGGRPNPAGYPGSSVSLLFTISSVDKDDIIEPQDEKARLALAFYREGLSINHIFYSFLSFYKIINMIKSSGPDQISWINSKLDQLSYEAKKRITEIESDIKDIGKYLFKRGRCAVAHASLKSTEDNPNADPDDPDDQERFRKDKVLIKEVSAIVIEEEFGIKSSMSLYKERDKDGRYRIQKLLNIFDQESLIKGILKTDIPFIKLGIRGKEPNQLTEQLYFNENAHFSDKKITIDTFTQNRRAMFRFSIDTEKNDLFIDLDYVVCKLKKEKDKINAEIDLNSLILMRDYLSNGQIRIYSPDGKLLAFSTPYRPSLDLGRSISDLNKKIETAKFALEKFN